MQREIRLNLLVLLHNEVLLGFSEGETLFYLEVRDRVRALAHCPEVIVKHLHGESGRVHGTFAAVEEHLAEVVVDRELGSFVVFTGSVLQILNNFVGHSSEGQILRLLVRHLID